MSCLDGGTRSVGGQHGMHYKTKPLCDYNSYFKCSSEQGAGAPPVSSIFMSTCSGARTSAANFDLVWVVKKKKKKKKKKKEKERKKKIFSL